MNLRYTTLLILLMMISSIPNRVSAQTESTAEPGVEIDYRSLYGEGIEYGLFLDEATRRKAMWDKNTELATVPPEISLRVEGIASKWHLLVVAVDGCSDSANIIPYLSALAESTDKIDLRIIDSDTGRPVMEANRTPDNRPATPTIAVLAEDSFVPAGYLVERPDELQNWALENKGSLSSREFLNQKFAWYDEDRGHSSMDAILDIIEKAESE